MKIKKYVLRGYQQRVLERILWAQKLEGNDLVSLATGSGKSLICAALVKKLNTNVLVIVPSREILKQNYEKLSHYVKKKDIGIFSAGMKQKVVKKITIATIQSCFRHPEKFAHFKQVICDEADLIDFKNKAGMFTRFLEGIGQPKLIGLTATCFRMTKMGRNRGVGIKLINRMQPWFWKRIIANVTTLELTEQKYLTPLIYLPMKIIDAKDIPINRSKTDYDMTLYQEKIADKGEQIRKIISYAMANSKKVVVFCSSIEQAEQLALQTKGAQAVSAKTPSKERDRIIADFKAGRTKIVFNCMLLGIGYDDAELDCAVILRPTKSIRLLNQFLGRLTRIHPNKIESLVIDATDSVKQIGRLHTIRLEKVEGRWELLSETGSWHNREIYSQLQPQTSQQKFHRTFNFDPQYNKQQRIPL